jgi:hypothetical protein
MSEPGPGGAGYANQFEVGYNAFEFRFDFSQHGGGDNAHSGAVHARVVTVPAYAKVFLGLLDRSIGEYEAQYGVISLSSPASGLELAPDDAG